MLSSLRESGAETSFLRGLAQSSAGRREAAQSEFEQTLAAAPAHELARFQLARSLEEQSCFAAATEHYERLLAAAPERFTWRLNAARVLRKTGRLNAARNVLRPPDSEAAAPGALAMEMGEIEYESGNYAAARGWFEQADLKAAHVAESLRSAASNFAFAGEPVKSRDLFVRVDDAQDNSRLQGELRRRLAIDPSDAVAAAELAHLSEPQAEIASATSASPLFMEHCGICHGADGGGDGPAARYLFPRPRNLRTDKYRLVSTESRTPTLTDIERLIRQGIPGSSMPPLAGLPSEQIRDLAVEVLLRARQRFGDSPVDENTPLPIPDLRNADAESIARGKAIYLSSGCHNCHGSDGGGETDLALFDDEGRPTSPRDLVRDPLKGGASAEAMYLRIRLGMPGTPHPASPSLTAEELVALVHFCRSLGHEPKQKLTNHERATRAARWPVAPRLREG